MTANKELTTIENTIFNSDFREEMGLLQCDGFNGKWRISISQGAQRFES